MAYLLATLGTKVQRYVVDITRHGDLSAFVKGEYDLVDVLDLELVAGFGDKATTKRVALAIGLATWRYVKMDGPKHVLTLVEAEAH